MKTTIYTSVLLGILFIVSGAYAQENVKTTVAPATQTNQTVETKAQNNNTVRSNRTETKAAIDQPGTSSSASKKGYEYYQSKSDLNSAGKQTKAQDHNSTRSNKTGSVVAPNNPDGGGNPDEKPILPIDKSEAVQTKKK
jgi:hypothetical protein